MDESFYTDLVIGFNFNDPEKDISFESLFSQDAESEFSLSSDVYGLLRLTDTDDFDNFNQFSRYVNVFDNFEYTVTNVPTPPFIVHFLLGVIFLMIRLTKTRFLR